MTSPTKTSTKSRGDRVPARTKTSLTAIEKARAEYKALKSK